MKRPGPVGLVILLVFAIPVIIEIRTILAMLGIEVSATVFFPTMIALVAVAILLLYVLPETGDSGKAIEV